MTADSPQPRARRGLQRFGRGIRARILVYAILLLFVGIAFTVVTMRQILLVRLDSRVEESLVQEVREFRSLASGIDPRTGRPFGPRLRPLFDLYLERNVPAVGEQLLTFRRGRFYREKDTHPDMFRLSSRDDLVARWSRLDRPESGTLDTPSGPVRYLAVPVASRAGRTGTFVVANFTRGERDEIQEAVVAASVVGAMVLLIGSLIAYLAAGRTLVPLRELTEAVRTIESSDLTRRIEVGGNDELAELGRTFNAMLDRLETAFASQRELIRDVSHELRTPITIVRGHLELLGEDPAERRETVELVTDELDRMGRLVEDLLLLARAERPDFIRSEPIDLADFTADVLGKVRPLGDRSWQSDPGTGTFHGDPQRLTQAVVNLAENAVKQTEKGARIEIGSARADGSVRIWVADSGTGIDPATAHELFRRFSRGSGRRYEGTGLGLAIVKAIAEGHGGRVEVDGELGRGARFTIVIADATAPRREDVPR